MQPNEKLALLYEDWMTWLDRQHFDEMMKCLHGDELELLSGEKYLYLLMQSRHGQTKH